MIKHVDCTNPIVSAEYKLLPMLEFDKLELGVRVAASYSLGGWQTYHVLPKFDFSPPIRKVNEASRNSRNSNASSRGDFPPEHM